MNFVYIKTATNSFSNQFLETEHVAYHMYSYFKVSIFYRAKFPLLSWVSPFTGLDWTGLDWTGLDWTGLDWTGLDYWTGLLDSKYAY